MNYPGKVSLLYYVVHAKKRVCRKIEWALESLSWFFIRPFRRARNEEPKMTIGITTIMDRYESCLRPLVRKIAALFPNQQIIVIANGHVKKVEQKKYLECVEKFCSTFMNVELVKFNEPKGLSHLWNVIINKSKYSEVLILNDDIKIKVNLSKFIYRSGILNEKIATINSSWSYFLISKDLYELIGPFDEELKEVGGEDDDYAARLAIKGVDVANFITRTIIAKLGRINKLITCNSYGKNMFLEAYGYSNANSEYLFKKWETSMEYFSGAIMVPNRKWRYWKLREHNRELKEI